MKKLVIMLNNPGDIIMALLACGDISGKAEDIYFLVDSENKGILEKFSLNVIYYERKIFQEQFFKNSELSEIEIEIKNFINCLISYDFDEVVNLYQGDESAVLTRLITDGLATAIKGRYFDYDGLFRIDDLFSKYLYTIPFNRELNCFHTVEIYKKIIGVEIDDNFDYSHCYKENKKVIEKFGLTPGYIVVQVSSAWKSKRYPAVLTAKVINGLVKKGYKVVLTGAKAEKEAERDVLNNIESNMCHGVVSVVGKTSLDELIDVVHYSEVVISPDTLTMHLGALFNKKVVALFSATNFLETGPYCSNAHIVRSKNDFPFYGCFNFSCETHISDIKPELISLLATDGSSVHMEPDVYVFKTLVGKSGIKYLPLNGGDSFLPGELNEAIHKVLSISEPSFAAEDLLVEKVSQEEKKCVEIIDQLERLYKTLRDELQGKIDSNKIGELLSKISGCEKSLDLIENEKYKLFMRVYRISYNGISQRCTKDFVDEVILNLRELKGRVLSINMFFRKFTD